jgi:hypothetical protein
MVPLAHATDGSGSRGEGLLPKRNSRKGSGRAVSGRDQEESTERNLSEGGLDVTQAAFQRVADTSEGRVQVAWPFA